MPIKNYVDELLKQRKYDLSLYTALPKNMASVLTEESKRGMVVSDDVRCSRVGVYQLEHKGNAIDAAIATQLCLSVIEVQSTGLAGGGFSLSLIDRNLSALNFRETAPIKMITHSLQPKKSGPNSFGIPGNPYGMYELWKQGGKLKWSSLFELPIIIAYKGWQLKRHCYLSAHLHRKEIYRDPLLRQMFFKNKMLKTVGSKIRNPKLAKSLYILSRDHTSMNKGTLAKIMSKVLRKKGAPHRLRDFERYQVKPQKFLKLNLDESKYLITTSERSGGPLLAYIIESMQGFFQRQTRSYGTSDMENVYYKTLINVIKRSIRDTSKLLKFSKNLFHQEFYHEEFSSRENFQSLDNEGTSSLNVIDIHGNGISITSTINHQFGAKFSFPGTGILANNDLADFNRFTKKSPKPKVYKNNPYYHSRPLSSMAPSLIIERKSKRLLGLFSGTGGKKIPSSLAQVIMNHYFKKFSLASSISRFRVFHPYSPNVYVPVTLGRLLKLFRVHYEEVQPIPNRVKEYLKKYSINTKGLKEAHSSAVTGISILRDRHSRSTNIFGAADFRKDGGVAGL